MPIRSHIISPRPTSLPPPTSHGGQTVHQFLRVDRDSFVINPFAVVRISNLRQVRLQRAGKQPIWTFRAEVEPACEVAPNCQFRRQVRRFKEDATLLLQNADRKLGVVRRHDLISPNVCSVHDPASRYLTFLSPDPFHFTIRFKDFQNLRLLQDVNAEFLCCFSERLGGGNGVRVPRTRFVCSSRQSLNTSIWLKLLQLAGLEDRSLDAQPSLHIHISPQCRLVLASN